MRSTFTKKQAALAVACVLTLGAFSSAVSAQVKDIDGSINEKALLLDTRGAPIMSGTGLCWHTAYGPSPLWTGECHAAVPVPVAQYIAPAPVPYVAPASAPAPIVVAAVAAVPAYEKVMLDADALFDFDKSSLRPAGREALDKFVKDMQGISPATIAAVGHTDRLGSASYNQTLSEERVASVKAYLVSKGVQSSDVQTSAKGETQPMTKSGQCSGATNAKLIACLQPDRRVEMEVSGQRVKR